jgi:hypothetical protein
MVGEAERKEKPQNLQKPKKKAKTVKNNPANTFSMPDGSILDTTTLDFGGNKITEKEMRFVFYYTFPGTDAFQCQARAAARAGYKNSFMLGYQLRHKPSVAAAIKYVLDTKVKVDLDEEYNKIIELKKRRIHYDIGEFVKKSTRYIKLGKGDDAETVEVVDENLKDLEELSPEQRQVIDGIDYKGVQGIKIYNFADRDKAMADVLALYNKVNGATDDNAFDVEMTAEIIKGNLAVKVAARKKKQDIGKTADFVRVADEKIEEL